jgi:hypothetical protein
MAVDRVLCAVDAPSSSTTSRLGNAVPPRQIQAETKVKALSGNEKRLSRAFAFRHLSIQHRDSIF